MSEEIQEEGNNVVTPDFGGEKQDEPAFGVHVMMMPTGAFAMRVTGDPNLGEIQMLLSRALVSTECRMTAETVLHLQQQQAEKSRIITPGQVR